MKKLDSKCLEKLVILALGVYGRPIEFERLDVVVYLILKAIPDIVEVVCRDD